jgi:hypothetical protein
MDALTSKEPRHLAAAAAAASAGSVASPKLLVVRGDTGKYE